MSPLSREAVFNCFLTYEPGSRELQEAGLDLEY